MDGSARQPRWVVYLARVFLILAAGDSLAYGGWIIARPAGLFELFGLAPGTKLRPEGFFGPVEDRRLLWTCLGVALLFQGFCLLAAAVQSARFRSLLFVPLLGRGLLVGLWVWLLASDRLLLPREPLLALLAHDAVWLPGLVVCLTLSRGEVLEERKPRSENEDRAGGPPGV
jgi:hypothetical protein